ncbi:MAG: hypothetical protein ACM3PZ_02810 [Bacillota bacterium]
MLRKEMLILVIGLVALFTACEKIGDSNKDDGEYIILKSTEATIRNDSIFTPLGRDVSFWIETSFPSPVYDVIISNGYDPAVSSLGVFTARWTEFGITALTVIAKDLNGATYSKVYIVKAGDYSAGGGVLVRWISSIKNGSSYDVTFALQKSGMIRNKQNYAYVGTNVGWQWPITISSYDTNYRLADNNTLERVYNEFAPWISVRVTNVPGNYRMGVGKYDANGKLIWGSFPGSSYALDAADPTMLYYTLDSNGNVTPN